MNGTNTRNIGIYDADINSQVLINGISVKKKGQKPPEKPVHICGAFVFFARGYKDTVADQEQLAIAFVNAQEPNKYTLIGVGYGKEISVEVH